MADGELARKAAPPVPRFELPATAPSSSIAVLKDEGSSEGDFWHDDRVTFNRSYRAFVKEAGLTTAQEEAFRISLAEMQDKLTAVREHHRELRRMAIHDAIWRGQDPPKTDLREESAEKKKLQIEMDERAAKILNPSQGEMLRRGIEYIPIRRLPGLGSQPFETSR